MDKELEEGVHEGNFACVDCSSSDAMSVYSHDSGKFTGFCRSICSSSKEFKAFKSNNKLAKSELADKFGIKEIKLRSRRSAVKDKKEEVEEVEERTKVTSRRSRVKKKTSLPMTKKEREDVESNTSLKGRGYRGLTDKWNKYFRVRTEYDGETGEVLNRFYPVTKGTLLKNIKLVGYKKRIVLPEKDFRAVGMNSKDCDLFGMFTCKGSGKYILLVGGEEDTIAAKQILESAKKENYAPIDVVSSSIGETSFAAQVKANYEFLDGYDKIILNMDSDVAGEEAQEALFESLPMSKVRILEMPQDCKDACNVIEEGLEQEYIQAFYNASKPKISGIVSSLDLHSRILDTCDLATIPLPPFMRKANNMLCGGFPVAEIINILAASGIGKTTFVNEFTYYWIFHCPYKVGVLSMEAGSGKYGEKLLSRHLKINLSRMSDTDEEGNFLNTKNRKREFLQLQSTLEESQSLYEDEEGEERFALIDERGDLESIADVKRKIIQLIKGCGCRVIIIDPVQDILDSLIIEEQAEFCAWQKKMKSQGVTFININHARKGAGGVKSAGRGAELDEQDMQGTSALYKSGAVNMILSRDKEAEDDLERNTTSITGSAGAMYYEMETHTIYDSETWMQREV
jgi:twinkle protein